VVSGELQPIRQMPGSSSFNEVRVTDPTVSNALRASGMWVNGAGPHAHVMARAALSFVTSSPRSAKYVVAACRCSGARLCVCAGEGGGDEATQYGPVALEVAVTLLDTAHHHLCEVAQKQVDVRPGQPARQFIVSDGGV